MEETQAKDLQSHKDGTPVPTPPEKSASVESAPVAQSQTEKEPTLTSRDNPAHDTAAHDAAAHDAAAHDTAAPMPPVEELRLPTSTRSVSDAAEQDPLAHRPRIATIIGSVLCGLLFLALAAACWWLLVRTLSGQQLDNMGYAGYADNLPLVMLIPAKVIELSWNVGQVRLSVSILCDVIFAIFVITITAARKRWMLLIQVALFAGIAIGGAELLKHTLPRTSMDRSLFMAVGNSSPSGHMAAAAAAAVALLCVVPRVWRAAVAVIGAVYTSCVATALLAQGYHRPGDVVAALLWVFGLALLMLATTRGKTMDAPGSRLASASIQIVASLMITIGVCAMAYAGYVIWQLMPGVQFEAMWATWAAHIAMNFINMALPCLGFGVVLAFRHASAAPLSKLGMLGMPPAPPAGGRRK